MGTRKFPYSTYITIGILSYVCLLGPWITFIPLWDSMDYLANYLFDPNYPAKGQWILDSNGHPSMGYFWPFWIAHTLFPYQVIPVHLINMGMGAITIVGFARILEALFPENAASSEMGLLVMIFSIHPVLTANGLNMSPDYGVLCYFILTFWAVLKRRFFLAAVPGLLLVFSKEPGIPLYLSILILAVWREKPDYHRMMPLLIPCFALLVFALYQGARQEPVFPFANDYMGQKGFFHYIVPDPRRPDFYMAALGTFVLNFQWIFTCFLVLLIPRALFQGGNQVKRILFQKNFLVCLGLLFFAFYILSRLYLHINLRYLSVIFPLLLLCFFFSMMSMDFLKPFRPKILVAIYLLFLGNSYFTLDPVSRAIAGTFQFGERAVLNMASIRPECCGYGRDQLVYNLQYMNLHPLLDMAMADLKPGHDSVIAVPHSAWLILTGLDGSSHHRTLDIRPDRMIKPKLLTAQVILNMEDRPESVTFVDTPYADNSRLKESLVMAYHSAESRTYFHRGYSLNVLLLEDPVD